MVKNACIAWALLLMTSTFVLAPITGAAAVMWVLLAMPMVAISLTYQPKYIKDYSVAAFVIIAIYALLIIAQGLIQFPYSNPQFDNVPVWPMLDANNAAAVLNFGLIPSFYFALRNRRWWFLVALFAAAMVITHSRAGMGAAIIACFILLCSHIGRRNTKYLIALLVFLVLDLYAFWDERLTPNMDSLWFRFQIWDNTLEIVKAAGFTGYGLGSFPYMYQWIKHPSDPSVYYAHNDLLQFMIEGGWIVASSFIWLICAVIIKTTRENILPACVMLAILAQSMLEFQFYVPVISILMGLPLVIHMSGGLLITRNFDCPATR